MLGGLSKNSKESGGIGMIYENKHILVEKLENKIAVLTINKEPFNLTCKESMTEFRKILRSLETDKDVNVVVITGSGEKSFCCGGDLSEFEDWKGRMAEANFKLETDLFNMIEFLTKPIIAAIDGYSLGGGFEMALACDFRIMSKKSKVSLPEIQLGVFPGSGGMYRLPKIVGYSKALEIMLTGEMIDAEECFKLGIALKLTENGKALESALELAEKIASKANNAVMATKKGTRDFWLKTSEENYYHCLTMIEDIYNQYNAYEGVDAFLEKREPRFE
jgi:enoyl-CoA hydratase/carnithine racemase